MTKVYDFSVFDIREHNFAFGEMDEAEIVAKKKALEDHQKSKVAAAAHPAPVVEDKKETSDTPKPSKPVFRPKIKPAGPPPGTS
jgi:NADH-quinone oxidoreductase subunit I